MTGNEYQALAMRTNDRKRQKEFRINLICLNLAKRTISHLCKIMTLAVSLMLALGYPEGFDIERANHRAEGDV